jgi:RluA family pseudouridine synthase
LTTGAIQGDHVSDPHASGLSVLADNDMLVAVDKPEGLASIADRTGSSVNLHSILQDLLGSRLYVVHRLDRPTSGVILFARTPESHRRLSLAFQSGHVRKTYHAVLLGSLPGESGVIEEPLRRFGSGRVWVDARRGKPSVTCFEVLERGTGYTLAAIRPRTGRQHQIRAHMAFLGNPVAGDRTYARGSSVADQPWPRLMLHASELEIETGDGEALLFRSGLPSSFTVPLEAARARAAQRRLQ